MKLFYVELDGFNEYCNKGYVVANDCLEAENKLVKHASGWDEGRSVPRKAKKIEYLADLHGGDNRHYVGAMYPIFIN